jgi:hypothetical protein
MFCSDVLLFTPTGDLDITYNLELQCTPELQNITLIENYNINGINESSLFF